MRGSERIFTADFSPRAWMRAWTLTPRLSTELVNRPGRRSFFWPVMVPPAVLPATDGPKEMALSPFNGMMAELDQRRPRAVASSMLISAMTAESRTCRPGLSSLAMTSLSASWYSGGERIISAF